MPTNYFVGSGPREDYPERIKRLRADLGLTQQSLADCIGVSFTIVNRWENGQTAPSQPSWNLLRDLESGVAEDEARYGEEPGPPVMLDFTARPDTVKVLAEGERLSFGHLMNPTLLDEGGSRFLVCTDAAGEGIDLQVCWIMINYDIPWNPARLEQRMGRIHRYGQKHDPVRILNLIAPSTGEGKVLKCLLDKLEKIRKQLKSDKVFDCIGRVYAGIEY